MKSKMVSIFLSIVMVASIFAAFTQNFGPISMNASAAGGLADSPWPMFRGNLNHTGLSPYDTSTNPGKLKWSFMTGAYVYSPPSIGSDGTIYVGSYDNKLYAINPYGSEIWSYSTGSGVGSSPTIGSDGTIYIGSYDTKLYAIRPNGTEKWNFKTGHDIRSSPAIGSDGTIYMGSQDTKLYAINPDGTEKWNFPTGDSVESSPAIDSDGTIYVGSLDHKLYAINPDGTEKWNFTTGDRVWSSPAIGSDETIYVGSDDNKLYAIDQYGTEKWNFTTYGDVFSSPAIGLDGTIYVGSNDGKMYTINPDGTQKWNFTTGPWVISSPAIGSDGTIYVGSGDNNLYAINSDGTEKWRYATGDGIISSPAIGSDGTIFVGSRDNKLHAIGNPNLKVEVTSHFSTLNSAAQSAITVHVTNGTNPIQGANINLTTDNGGMFSPQSGTIDINGNFTSIFNAPIVTTQIICRITAQANKTGYNNGSGYVDITIEPIPWPMFRQNLNHTGLSPYDTSGNNGQLIWSFTTDDVIESSPTIGPNGTIYVGSFDKKVYAINPDGTEKWSFTTGFGVWSSPAIGSDGTIYVGSNDNKLYAITSDGTEKWSFKTAGWVTSSPTIGSDGTIYVGSWDGKLYAINPNGTEEWSFTTGWFVRSSPAIGSDGTIYVGSFDKKLYAINPNGTEKWSFTTGFGVWSSPAVGSDGTIYIGSNDHKLYAINPDGSEKWNFTTGHVVYSSPAIGFDDTIYIGSDDHKLYAINPDGTQKWNFTTGYYILTSPAIGSDGTIYVGSCDNRLYAINLDGSEKWNFTPGDHVHSSPAIGSDGTIYVGSADGRLYAIGTLNTPPVADAGSDQTVNWEDIVQFNGSASYDPDGTIVTFEWDFNASDGLWWDTGAPPDAIGPDPTYTYDEYGIFIATLRVTDNNGSMDTDICEITVLVPPPLPPPLYINMSLVGYDVILNWDPPSIPGIDHYSIYRSTSQTGFDFNTPWVNTSSDNESGEPGPIPLRTMWNDTNAALPGDPNYKEEYYYIVRAMNVVGEVSSTSRTVGKWTNTFPQGVSTFSIPLEPLETMNSTADYYLKDMKAKYIKWMDPVNHIWMKHGDGGVNDTQMEVGKGYEVAFDSPTNYTFIGMPGAMILFDNLSFGFDAELSTGNADSLTAMVDPASGDVDLGWDAAVGIDTYYLYNSSSRDGFWGTLGIDYYLLATTPLGVESYTHDGAALAGTEQYYMVVPFISGTGERGVSSYTLGVWTAGYLDQYDTFALPLKPSSNQTADWYCDNIPNTVGMNYYMNSAQRWGWHSTRMPAGAYDPILEMTEGYQISTSGATKFTFIGV